jgi:hypothetical protein
MIGLMATVYVRLLGEGTTVYRPAPAEFLSDDVAKLLASADHDPADEEWEFAPGRLVRVERRVLQGTEEYVAVSAA